MGPKIKMHKRLMLCDLVLELIPTSYIQVHEFCTMMFPLFASVLLQRNSNSISVQHLRQQSAESGAKDQDAQAPPGVV